MNPPLLKRKSSLFLIIIIFSGIILYLPSLQVKFINDEIAFISRNGVENISSLPSLFDKKDYDGDYYRPLPDFISGLITMAFGYETIYYRLFNVLIHIGNGLLVFFLTGLLLKGKEFSGLASLFASIFFLAFPLNDYPAIWHTDLFDRMMMMFYLLSVIYYLKKASSGFLSLLFFTFSLLSKEMAFSLPFVIIILSYINNPEIKPVNALKKSFPYFGLLILFIAFRFLVFDNNIFLLQDAHSGKGIFSIIRNIALFMGMLVFPFVIRQIQDISLSNFTVVVIPSLVLFAAISLHVLKYHKKDRLFWLLVIMLILTILPASRLLMRWYLYLPSSIFAIITAYMIFTFARNIRMGIIIALLLFGVYYTYTLYEITKWIEVSAQGEEIVNDFKTNYENVIDAKELVFLTVPAKSGDIPLFQLGFDHHLRHFLGTSNNVNVLSKSYMDDAGERIIISRKAGDLSMMHTGDNYFMLSDLEKSIKFKNRDLTGDRLKRISYNIIKEPDKIFFTFSEGKFHLIKEIK